MNVKLSQQIEALDRDEVYVIPYATNREVRMLRWTVSNLNTSYGYRAFKSYQSKDRDAVIAEAVDYDRNHGN